jgi:hypothetical protein
MISADLSAAVTAEREAAAFSRSRLNGVKVSDCAGRSESGMDMRLAADSLQDIGLFRATDIIGGFHGAA